MHIPQSRSSAECTLGTRKTDSMQRANFAMEVGQGTHTQMDTGKRNLKCRFKKFYRSFSS